jgi:hypothetical protein
MHQFEIVRLCALWDGADAEKENIPTVIELINDGSARWSRHVRSPQGGPAFFAQVLDEPYQQF